MHKTVFTAVAKGKPIVLKMSVGDGEPKMLKQYAEHLARNSHRVSAVLESKDPNALLDVARKDFESQVRDELATLEKMQPRGGGRVPSSSVATVLGVCLSDGNNTVAPMMAQEGPLLPYNDAIAADLPPLARLRLLANAMATLSQTFELGLVPCSLNTKQLGVNKELRVKWVDVGHVRSMAKRADGSFAPLFSEHSCIKNDQCHPSRFNCPVGDVDAVCTSSEKRCRGISRKTLSARSCQLFGRVLFPVIGKGKPAPLVAAVHKVLDKCTTEKHHESKIISPTRPNVALFVK